MAVKLQLKLREVRESLILDVSVARRLAILVQAKDASGLLAFVGALGEKKQFIHDRHWLLELCSWAGREGKSAKDLARWAMLIQRVDSLDDTREGVFTLSDSQADMLWKRLNDKDFVLGKLTPQFAGFMLDFGKAHGNRRFEDVGDDDLFEEASS